MMNDETIYNMNLMPCEHTCIFITQCAQAAAVRMNCQRYNPRAVSSATISFIFLIKTSHHLFDVDFRNFVLKLIPFIIQGLLH